MEKKKKGFENQKFKPANVIDLNGKVKIIVE